MAQLIAAIPGTFKFDDNPVNRDLHSALPDILRTCKQLQVLQDAVFNFSESDFRQPIDFLINTIWASSRQEEADNMMVFLGKTLVLPDTTKSTLSILCSTSTAGSVSCIKFGLSSLTLQQREAYSCFPTPPPSLLLVHLVVGFQGRDIPDTVSQRQVLIGMVSACYQRRALCVPDQYVFGISHHRSCIVSVFAARWKGSGPGHEAAHQYTRCWPTLPSPPSELEARCYYYGLPSRPVLVARTGTTPWEAPTGPEAYLVAKELRPVYNHALTEVWEDNLAFRLHAILDSMNVKWTSTDVLRIGIAGESSAPVVLWIGVMPASLSGDDGVVVASKCRELLEEYNITDVDVEIRESVVTRSSSPKLPTPADTFDATVDVCEPLTTTLGLPICAQSTPWAQGTGGFFITEGGNTERHLLVTARHVVFTPNKSENRLFEHKNASQRPYNVTLFGDAAFNTYLESIQAEIGAKAIIVDLCERRIKAIEGKDGAAAAKARKKPEAELNEANEAIGALHSFYQEVSTRWPTPESRVLGHVVLSPPISAGVGSESYTEDWAVIEIDASKVDASNFDGNAVDLGTHIPPEQLTLKMCPNPQNTHSFTYPADRLLRLQGAIPDNEMRNPTALDQNGEPCLPVITRSGISGLSVGRANNILSYARNYYGGDSVDTSKGWAIFSYDSKSGAFSAKGDSGSVIADGLGRIGGLLTGGAGTTASSDVTYATPINFILKRMQENGVCQPNVSAVLAA